MTVEGASLVRAPPEQELFVLCGTSWNLAHITSVPTHTSTIDVAVDEYVTVKNLWAIEFTIIFLLVREYCEFERMTFGFLNTAF